MTTRPGKRDTTTPRSDELLQIENAIGVIVRQATLPRAWAAMFDRAKVTLPAGVDRSAYPLLGRIHRFGPVRPTDLAHQTGVKISTISRQLAELERHGYVRRSVDPTDARASVFTLGKPGRVFLDRIRAARHEGMGERLANWNDRDLGALAALLTRFASDFAPDLCASDDAGERMPLKGTA